jgi:Spy/CpxP family protein refolding chaperone
MDQSASRNKWRLWSGIITVFIIGLVVGGLSATALVRSHVLHVMRGGPERPQERIAERLTRNLGLTAEQRTQMKGIERDFAPRFGEFEQRSRAEIKTIADEMEARIRAILTPDQRVKYDANIERIREEMTKRRHRGYGHRDAGPGGPEESRGAEVPAESR